MHYIHVVGYPSFLVTTCLLAVTACGGRAAGSEDSTEGSPTTTNDDSSTQTSLTTQTGEATQTGETTQTGPSETDPDSDAGESDEPECVEDEDCLPGEVCEDNVCEVFDCGIVQVLLELSLRAVMMGA